MRYESGMERSLLKALKELREIWKTGLNYKLLSLRPGTYEPPNFDSDLWWEYPDEAFRETAHPKGWPREKNCGCFRIGSDSEYGGDAGDVDEEECEEEDWQEVVEDGEGNEKEDDVDDVDLDSN